MKKILYTITFFTILILLSFSLFALRSNTLDRLIIDKSPINITSVDKCSHEELLQRIEKICSECKKDIGFIAYLSSDDGFSDTSIAFYMTSYTDDFMQFETASGSTIIPAGHYYTSEKNLLRNDPNALSACLPDHFSFYRLLEMPDYYMNKGDWIIRKSDMTTVSAVAAAHGLQLETAGNYLRDNALFYYLLGCSAVMIVICLFSMLFFQISESKKYAIMLLEGFSGKHIILGGMRSYAGMLIISALVSYIICGIGISIIDSIGLYLKYTIDYAWILLLFLAILLCIYICSCIYILLIHPLQSMKGRKKQKLLHMLTLSGKTLLMFLFFIIGEVNLVQFIALHSELALNQTIQEHFSGYHALVVNGVGSGDNTDTLSDFREFYDAACESNHAVLMNSRACINYENEGDLSSYFILINRNYLDFNPIYDLSGIPYQFDDIPKTDLIVLIPESASEEEARDYYSSEDVLHFYAHQDAELHIFKYPDDQRFYTLQTMDESKYPGYVMHAAVIIEGGYQFIEGPITQGAVIFRENTDNFRQEITPLLEKYGIKDYISAMPYASSEIQSVIAMIRVNLITVSGVLIFIAILLVCIVIYENWIYYKNNQKKITMKKMEGFSFFDIHKNSIIARILFYVVFLVLAVALKYHVIIAMTLSCMDYISFYFTLESKSAHYAATVLKGDCS